MSVKTIRYAKNTVSGTFGYGIHLYDELKSNDDPDAPNISAMVVEENIVKNSRKRKEWLSGSNTMSGWKSQLSGKIFCRKQITLGCWSDRLTALIEIIITLYNNGLQALNLGEGADPVAPSPNYQQYFNNRHNCRNIRDWFPEYLVDVSPAASKLK